MSELNDKDLNLQESKDNLVELLENQFGSDEQAVIADQLEVISDALYKQWQAMQILSCPLDPDKNDAGASTVEDFFIRVLLMLWDDPDDFNVGKGGWDTELLCQIANTFDWFGTPFLDSWDFSCADYELMELAINCLRRVS